ncbi:helix-turn-helix-type transcriptional regulator [Photobacterium gaetbulicola]|uniref:Putative MerR family transcriptional regulator n=1 Tax=Photobacterium gaetbulicola Gung47 TaxID=658445 RepID=A0A0C5WIF5_9GAMM|nr:MerR family transcriptional regulator [Photobacterium gaetbulicola]AJR05947.1 putative MerR family transcriptional regulator [Photobacterium gaetbulicola Gung47]PSU13243.1 helix-turn-helix-type transcriptional regulator [Photobacterium gaetbulicola]
MDSENKYYAIKDVSEITGVNSVTLRAWQRRYGLINPKRTEKGHRLYSAQDIKTIREIVEWLDKGVAIGKVKPMLGKLTPYNNNDEQNDSQKGVGNILSALAQLNASSLDKQLIQLMKEYPVKVLESKIVRVVINEICQPDNPLQDVQRVIWDTVLQERCLSLIAASRKRNKKACILMSFDQQPSSRFWLKAVELSEAGYSVTILPRYQGKLAPLTSLLNSWSDKKLYIDGNNKLPTDVLAQIEQLISMTGSELLSFGLINTIHPELLEWQHESA